MKMKYKREDIIKMVSEYEKELKQQMETVRPEVKWLQEKFAGIMKRYGLNSRKETDILIYERMYGRQPERTSEYLKVRYWRTGRYTPANRSVCLNLAQALELSQDETKFLLQGYYDCCDTFYPDSESAAKTGEDYLSRYEYMKELIRTYLRRIPEETMRKLRIDPEERAHYFRHLYFTDAFHYISLQQPLNPEVFRKHITSTRYDSELRRQIKLEGEVPRRTMLRHLLLLNAPDLSVEKISGQLAFFGYLPLDKNHTLTGGEYLDRLVLSLLELYEGIYDPEKPAAGLLWFQEACRTLDEYFAERNCPKMRFMHFKALEL